MNNKKSAILFFVKYPIAGRVKTRLGKSIGFQTAARVYRQLADNNIQILKSSSIADLIIVYDPTTEVSSFQIWFSDASMFVAQQGTTLGERLTHAFQWAFDQGYSKATAFGSDTLGLTGDIVQKNFDALDSVDVVVGPAQDGGYYLIGLGQQRPELFNNIDWSTPQVLSQTQDIIEQLNLKSHMLSVLDDFDEIEEVGTH